MSYGNNNKFVVVSADDGDPDVSWAHHLARKSAGGVDCVAAYGTAIYSPISGRVSLVQNGKTNSGGRTVRVTNSDHADEFMHLSKFAVKHGQAVKQGQMLGYSGASGFGEDHFYAPHVHWHRIQPNGQRVNPWNYFTATRADAFSIISHHWMDLLKRKPSLATKVRFAPAIMKNRKSGTHKLRVYAKGTSAYKRLRGK